LDGKYFKVDKLKKSKISVIGIGKLGLCFALNLERAGFEVCGMDVREDYINSLNSKKFTSPEPLVDEFLKESENLVFTSDLKRAIESDIIFICVDTPSTPEYRYDHSKIESIIGSILDFGESENRKELVINSTTFPGFCEELAGCLSSFNYYVSYNPEFIAQGTIIHDQLNSDHVLIGEADELAGEKISFVYQKMCHSNPVINRMSRTEAEITKLSVNCFLTTKISFANMIGDISERYKCNSERILDAVGSDLRIGKKYLKPGFGFGGPCFPRDNRALARCANDVGVDALISLATDQMNEKHLNYQVESFIKRNPDKNIPVYFHTVTYKPESVSLEESQQLKFALELKKLGYTVVVHDKRNEVVEKLKDFFN
jgi:UDPglucose 6-dehydrogenase